MSTTSYAAHVQRMQQQGSKPMPISQFVRLVVSIYRMERQERK